MTLEEKSAMESALVVGMGYWLIIGFIMFVMRPFFAWLHSKREEDRDA